MRKKIMPDFKLISADSHVNEPPAAWERLQKEYGERAPRVAKDPPGVPKGIWLVIDGLPPVGLSHYSKGLAVEKTKGISEVDQEKHFETIRFNETFRYEDYPGGWEPTARLKDQGTDGVDAEVLFSSAARQLYSITDEPYQRAIFRSYNEWLAEFCSVDRKRLIGLALLPILDMDHTVEDIQHYAKLGFRGVQLPTRIKDSGYYESRLRTHVGDAGRNRDGDQRPYQRYPRGRAHALRRAARCRSKKTGPRLGQQTGAGAAIPRQHDSVRRFRPPPQT
jgi:hypothetical protein